jgi:hypothetical protein
MISERFLRIFSNKPPEPRDRLKDPFRDDRLFRTFLFTLILFVEFTLGLTLQRPVRHSECCKVKQDDNTDNNATGDGTECGTVEPRFRREDGDAENPCSKQQYKQCEIDTPQPTMNRFSVRDFHRWMTEIIAEFMSPVLVLDASGRIERVCEQVFLNHADTRSIDVVVLIPSCLDTEEERRDDHSGQQMAWEVPLEENAYVRIAAITVTAQVVA